MGTLWLLLQTYLILCGVILNIVLLVSLVISLEAGRMEKKPPKLEEE